MEEGRGKGRVNFSYQPQNVLAASNFLEIMTYILFIDASHDLSFQNLL